MNKDLGGPAFRFAPLLLDFGGRLVFGGLMYDLVDMKDLSSDFSVGRWIVRFPNFGDPRHGLLTFSLRTILAFGVWDYRVDLSFLYRPVLIPLI